MKKPTLWLRISSVIALLLCAGHTSGVPWTPDETERGLALVGEMRAYHFDALGASRSYDDFYRGFGLSCSVALLLGAILLWQLGTLAKTNAKATRPMVTAIWLAYAAYAVLDSMYFFIIPLVMALCVVVCLLPALVLAGREQGN
jgi:hypothetical protein